jgi:hypothetical protein
MFYQLTGCVRGAIRASMPERLVHRYYDPTTGQFLTIDLDLQQTQEPYNYATDNPVNAMDPLGLFCWGWCTFTDAWHDAFAGYDWLNGEFNDVLVRGWHDVYDVLHSEALHHALQVVSVVASGVGAVASMVAFLPPPVGEVAEIVSISAGGVAFAADLVNCAAANCDAASLTLDALAVVPGLASAREGRVLEEAEEELKGIRLNRAGRYYNATNGRFVQQSLPEMLHDQVFSARLRQGIARVVAEGLSFSAAGAGAASSG